MTRVARLTRHGAALLCVSALACQVADEPLILRRSEPVEADGAASGASDAGTTTDGRRDEAEQEVDSGNRGEAERGPSDAQSAKLLYVVNKAEIAQANAALTKLSDARMRAFAEHMVEAHGAAQARQAALVQQLGIESIASELSSDLEYEASGVIARLEKATSEEIDRIYIDSQRTLHTKTLELLDERLLPAVEAAELRSELMHTRDDVRAHLDEAEALAETLSRPGRP